MLSHTISDTGLSLVYEPSTGAPVVDIVIIHGLQGHPYKTWASQRAPKRLEGKGSPSRRPRELKDERTSSFKSMLNRPLRRFSTRTTQKSKSALQEESLSASPPPPTFWPKDLLPDVCPNSRVLVYGYDTKISKFMAGPANTNSLFSHAKDFLFALGRDRALDRPLIFVAHSLGGIVVKEMLTRSSSAAEDHLKNIVDSTSAIIFLGTPHRGSSELASLAEWARSFIGAFRMQSNGAIIDTLGLRTTDLERAQESFSALWQRYDFRVKTFQEGLGLTGVNLGALGNKVVPDYSSLIGDAREHAETLQANHMEMCRFAGADDPNYHKVSGEIKSIYTSLIALNTLKVHRNGYIQRRQSLSSAVSSPDRHRAAEELNLSDIELSVLKSLRFPGMDSKHRILDAPAEETCHWLFEHETYKTWASGRNKEAHGGLLWIKGKPGAGKSILMKEAFREALEHQADSECAAFFFNAKGDYLEHSPVGLYRSLLYQLLPRHLDHLRRFVKLQWSKRDLDLAETESSVLFQESELRTFFQSMFTAKSTLHKKTMIFIDAIDECDMKHVRSQAYFWREVTNLAHAAGVDCNVCISSRHFPSINLANCPEIVVEAHNLQDITSYVDRKLDLSIPDNHAGRQALREKILRKSAGVFLWVVLVVDDVLQKQDEGKNLQFLLKEIDTIPEELGTLFSQMLSTVEQSAKDVTLRLFQWAILSAKPLRLREWHHVLAFIGDRPPPSLQDWRASDEFSESDEQLEKRIRSLSKGLLEVAFGTPEPLGMTFDAASVRAGAGSFELEYGETRAVQVIHESVREFFLQGGGYTILDPGHGLCSTADGHVSIMNTCIDYMNIRELDALVETRGLVGTELTLNVQSRPISRSSIAAASKQGSIIASATSKSASLKPEPITLRGGGPPLFYSRPSSTRRAGSIGSRGTAGTGGTIGTVASFGSAWSYTGFPNGANQANGAQSKPPSVYEKLKKWSDTAWDRDYFAQRMNLYNLDADRISFIPLDRTSIKASTAAGRSRILDDYPALLLYAVFEFFTHARLAEEGGANAAHIVHRLQESRAWQRWVILYEDLPQETSLLYYAADRGLSTWLSYTAGDPSSPGWRFDENVAQAIMEAVSNFSEQAFCLLLDHFGYDSSCKDSKGRPLLHVLVRQYDTTLLQIFLEYIKNPKLGPRLFSSSAGPLEGVDSSGRTALLVSAMKGDLTVMSSLLQHGADTNAKDSLGRTALHIVCSNDRAADLEPSKKIAASSDEMVKLLLEYDLDINIADQDGRTPLHVACYNIPERGQLTVAKGKENPSTRTEESINLSVIRLLLEKKPDVNKRDNIGATALHYTCRVETWRKECDNILEVVKLLLQAGADAAAVSSVGETALHIAAARCPDGRVAAELIRHGAKATASDSLGQVPLHHAAWAGNYDAAIRLLEEDQSMANQADNKGSTPLHVACQFFSTEPDLDRTSLAIIRQLLDSGALAYAKKNWLGLSPYDIAKFRSLSEVKSLMKNSSARPAPQHSTHQGLLSVPVLRRQQSDSEEEEECEGSEEQAEQSTAHSSSMPSKQRAGLFKYIPWLGMPFRGN